MSVDDVISNFIIESASARAKMQSKLLDIFVSTTGYFPSDLCLVEEHIKEGMDLKTIYYFDWKHRHRTAKINEEV